jgi:hypothetical protein
VSAPRQLTLDLFTESPEYTATLDHARGLRNEMKVVCYLVAAELEDRITPSQAVAIWRAVMGKKEPQP